MFTEFVDASRKIGGGLSTGHGVDIDQLDVDTDGVEIIPQRTFTGSKDGDVPISDFLKVAGVFDDKERGTF